MVRLMLLKHRQHDDLRHTDDFEKSDISRGSEQDDQFAPRTVLGRLGGAQGRDGQRAVLRHGPDGLAGRLGTIEVFFGVRLVEQEIEQALQVGFSRRSRLEGKTHRPSFLRLGSSLN